MKTSSFLPVRGRCPGFGYAVEDPSKDGACLLCKRSSVDLLVPDSDDSAGVVEGQAYAGLCEFCARAAAWVWARARNESPGLTPLGKSGQIESCRVVVLKTADVDKIADPVELDQIKVLVVRQQDLEPQALERWMLPGDDVPEGSDLTEVAVRTLREHGGATTWSQVVEPLWTGLDERGRLCQTYLARGYYLPAGRYECPKGHVTTNLSNDEVVDCGARVAGKKCRAMTKRIPSPVAPPSWMNLQKLLSDPLMTPLSGIALAVEQRRRSLSAESNLPNALCVRLRSQSRDLITLGLGRLGGQVPPEDMSPEDRDEQMSVLRTLLTPEEKLIADAVIGRKDEMDRMMQGVGGREQEETEVQEAEAPEAEDRGTEEDQVSDLDGDESFIRPRGPALGR